MFDNRKCLRSFFKLLKLLATPGSEKNLEVYLKNGKKIHLKVEVANAPQDQVKPRLALIKPDSGRETG